MRELGGLDSDADADADWLASFADFNLTQFPKKKPVHRNFHRAETNEGKFIATLKKKYVRVLACVRYTYVIFAILFLGILGEVKIDGQTQTDWRMFPMDFKQNFFDKYANSFFCNCNFANFVVLWASLPVKVPMKLNFRLVFLY